MKYYNCNLYINSYYYIIINFKALKIANTISIDEKNINETKNERHLRIRTFSAN